MQPKNDLKQSQVRSPRKLRLPKLPTKLLAIAAAVLILAAAGSYYFISYRPNHTNPSAYTYKTLNTYTLEGGKSGAGISVKKPAELGTSGKSAAKLQQVNFNQSITKNGQNIVIAQLSMASVFVSTPIQADYLKVLNGTITNPKSAGYNTLLTPVKDYVTQRLSSDYDVTFSEPKSLNTANLKSNAWVLNFTATAKKGQDKSKLPDLSGQTVLAIGKSTFYYFMVDATTYNWQGNQKTWQEVVNSIQLDR